VFFASGGRSVSAALAWRIADALAAACHPRPSPDASVLSVMDTLVWSAADVPALADVVRGGGVTTTDVDVLVVTMYEREAHSLVRLARLFVDDRNAAEDLVQEAFIRLARAAGRIEDHSRAAAYLRSIVLNLARDHNRRGLVSLRHHLPSRDVGGIVEDEITLRDDQRRVIHALRTLPHRQRDCLVLRYYHELGIEAIADTLGVSANSVKTHLRRGMEALERRLAVAEDAP
jgi:RNA polymerase sigma factor (sigma-70 family)